MAKGVVLTEEVKHLIAELYLNHPNWKTRKIHEEVIRRVQQIIPWAELGWPGISVVQKELAKIRKRDVERSLESKRLDDPWGTMSMAEYPLSPEALPTVLQVWVCAREKYSKVFTIRDALWTARLYAITKDISTLTILSLGHSYFEKTREILGIEMTSSEDPDLYLFEFVTKQKITPERRKKIFKVNKATWPHREKIEEWIEKYGVYEMIDKGYTFEEIEKKIKEVDNEGTHNKEG